MFDSRGTATARVRTSAALFGEGYCGQESMRFQVKSDEILDLQQLARTFTVAIEGR